MAVIVKDRVQETTATVGTVSLNLAGAVAGYIPFSSVMAIGDTCRYCINDQIVNIWETGIGTYSATNTLARTTVDASSNAGGLVSLPGNAATIVFIDMSAASILALAPLASPPLTGAVTVSGTLSVSTPVGVVSGGTGANTTAAARTTLGLTAASVLIQWTGGTVVGNGTYYFTIFAPFAGTINSMDYLIGTGSFTANVQVAGVSVTGLGAVAVSSATQANLAATAANTFTAGQVISLVVTAATGTATNAALNLRITRA